MKELYDYIIPLFIAYTFILLYRPVVGMTDTSSARVIDAK